MKLAVNSIVKTPRVKLLLLVTLSFTASVGASPAKAQPLVPASDGTDTKIKNTGDTYNITGGQLSGDGTNLFHSFTQFNLSEGQIANFLSNRKIQNILGRINGGDPSVINGLIQVTGGNSNLFLLNPAGIIFGPNASLDVPAAFSATTATGIGFDDDSWFQAFGENDWASLVGTPNALRFDPIAPGSILNEGNLTVATGESITLLGGTAINTGTIKAPSGNITVQAVTGQSILRISQAGQLLSLDITPDTEVPITPLSLPELLTGTDREHASSVSVNERGQLLLTGSGITVSASQGVAITSGTLDASSGFETELAPGGTVRVMGDRVGVVDANINVSGNDGGKVLIGGDGTSQTYISNDAVIAADGMRSGKGGSVRVAAEEMTGFYGTISARGGSSEPTNGGRVEVIGREGLDVTNASVDASAPRGNQGTWLLESGNIIIDNNNLLEGEIADIFDRTDKEAVVNASDISSALDNGTNVTLASRNVGSTQHPGQITVESAIKKTDGVQNTLALNAANEILVNGQISSDAGKLNVFVSTGGEIVFNPESPSASIFSNGGDIRLISNFSNIFAADIISKSTVPEKSEGGNGGNITLQAAGTIATGNIDSSSFIQSGNIELLASDKITTGNINAAGHISRVEIKLSGPLILERDISIDSGNRGSITFEGTVDGNQQLTVNSGAGTVQFQDTVGGSMGLSEQPGTRLNAVSVSGEGGNITLDSGGNINTLHLDSSGQNRGGDITLNSGGNIDTSSGSLISRGNIGEGGAITATARGDVITGAINSSSGGSGRGGNIPINTTNGKIDTITGEIISSSASGDGGTIDMVAAGDIITGTSIISSSGYNGGAIVLQSTGGSINTGDIDSSGVVGNGGDVTSQAQMGTVQTGNLNARGQGQGGQISIGADGEITTGQINTNAELGNGGNVSLTGGDVSVEFINAEGGSEGLGGDVAITGSLFRATGRFETSAASTNEASISTAGGTGGGTIAIRHTGASQFEPFHIGDAQILGTAAAITSGEFTMEPSQSFTGTSNLGNITIETNSPGIPLGEENLPPPEEEDPTLLAPPEEDLMLGEEITDPPEDLSEEPPGEVDLSPEEEPSPTISEPPVSEDSEPSTEPEVVLDTDDLIEPDENLPPQEEVVSDDVPVSEEVTRREPGKEETETADLQTEPDENLPPQEEVVSDDVPVSEEVTRREPGKEETETADLQTEPDTQADPSSEEEVMGRSASEEETSSIGSVDSIFFQNATGSDRELYRMASEREEEFTNQFAEYLQIPSDKYKVRTLDDARHFLGKIEQSIKVRPGIIYISFVPSQQKDGMEKREGESELIWENTPFRKNRLGKSGPKMESDHLELMLVTAEGLPIRYRIKEATRSRVMSTTQEFYREVTNRRKIDTTSYLPSAQQLYQWMIQPLRADLQGLGVQNLVFIMDGGLRSLPIAALHDGEEFLVQQYSFGLMPSLTLSDASYVDVKKKNLLAMGASEFLEHGPLPAVPIEIKKIAQEWGGESFLNQAFTFANLKSQLHKGSYGIIHLATHAEFRPGALSNSYIQLWSDRKLHLDQMEQVGWDKLQVDLVVLSACQTAFGNEEAEFGFAGFAVNAGVKSVLASLWYVSDEGTLGLMTEFYGQLKNAPIKAEALRQAQMAMISGRIHFEGDRLHLPAVAEGISLPPTLRGIQQTSLSHPYFWSAFTMIGNPW